MKPKQVQNVGEVLSDFLNKKNVKQETGAGHGQNLSVQWVALVADATGCAQKDQPSMTGKRRGQLSRLQSMWGRETYEVSKWTVHNWLQVMNTAREESGAMVGPPKPDVGYLLVHQHVARRLWAQAIAVEATPKESMSSTAPVCYAQIVQKETPEQKAARLAEQKAKWLASQ